MLAQQQPDTGSELHWHVTFKTQELSNIVWAFASLYSEGLSGSDVSEKLWYPADLFDAGGSPAFTPLAVIPCVPLPSSVAAWRVHVSTMPF